MRPNTKLMRAQAGADAVAPTPQIWNQLVEEIERLSRLTVGAGLTLSDQPGGRVISAVQRTSECWIKITGNIQDGINLRWKYAWSQVAKTAAGFGGWTVVAGGLSGTTSVFTAFNTVEEMNGSSGLFGNGVTSTNLTGSLALQPVPANAIVRAWIETPAAGVNEMHFVYANGIDGGC